MSAGGVSLGGGTSPKADSRACARDPLLYDLALLVAALPEDLRPYGAEVARAVLESDEASSKRPSLTTPSGCGATRTRRRAGTPATRSTRGCSRRTRWASGRPTSSARRPSARGWRWCARRARGLES